MKKWLMIAFFLLCGGVLFPTMHSISETSKLPSDPKKLYLDLIKRALMNSIYEDLDTNGSAISAEEREIGKPWPSQAHTMMGLKRLNNIQFCLESILANGIEGDCIETGVWRGGGCILMRAILKAYGDTTRKVWLADSFEGLPAPNVKKYPIDSSLNHLSKEKVLKVPLEEVQENFKKYGLLDNQVIFLEGFFKGTLPDAAIEKISLLRLDADYYESTIEALTALYPKLSIGGYLIIDDYAIPQCAAAVHDYRQQHHINELILPIDWTGVYWKKTR